jgi:hypothetical protein
VTWTEPSLHPGHFRIGIAANPAEFVTPTPVLSSGASNCRSAPIASNPSAPILVDGLSPHTTAAPVGVLAFLVLGLAARRRSGR